MKAREKPSERERRLADKLRENLRRRKQQSRARTTGDIEPGESPSEG